MSQEVYWTYKKRRSTKGCVCDFVSMCKCTIRLLSPESIKTIENGYYR